MASTPIRQPASWSIPTRLSSQLLRIQAVARSDEEAVRLKEALLRKVWRVVKVVVVLAVVALEAAWVALLVWGALSLFRAADSLFRVAVP